MPPSIVVASALSNSRIITAVNNQLTTSAKPCLADNRPKMSLAVMAACRSVRVSGGIVTNYVAAAAWHDRLRALVMTQL